MRRIHKAGLLILEQGAILLCRKQGSSWWILPGGKFEAGETPEQCLLREAREELAIEGLEGISFLGSFEDIAANEAGAIIAIDLYQAHLIGTPTPSQEIAELHWLRPTDNRSRLSPSLVNRILPALTRLGLWG